MSEKIINCPHCGKILPEELWPDKYEVRNWKLSALIVEVPKSGKLANAMSVQCSDIFVQIVVTAFQRNDDLRRGLMP